MADAPASTKDLPETATQLLVQGVDLEVIEGIDRGARFAATRDRW